MLWRDKDKLNRFLEEYLGLSADDILDVEIEPGQIRVRVALRNHMGNRYAIDNGIKDKDLASAEMTYYI